MKNKKVEYSSLYKLQESGDIIFNHQDVTLNPDKETQIESKLLIKLTEDDLEQIAGGGPWGPGFLNHNEVMLRITRFTSKNLYLKESSKFKSK